LEIENWKLEIAFAEKRKKEYIDFFYHYNSAPLLIINTADFDLVNGSCNYHILLEFIKKLPPGRNYFNPKEL